MSRATSCARWLTATLLAVSLAAGCASTPDAANEEPDEEPDKARQISVQSSEGPFEVAALWAEKFDEHDLDSEASEVVEQWPAATVARVWASGDDYRAVVIRRGGGREESPAILLHIAPDDEDTWSVVDLETTTSTHLWPKL